MSELINVPGEINVDFADVQSIMGYPGSALMAIGFGNGRMGAVEAAQQAIANPLLDLSIVDKGREGSSLLREGGGTS